METWLALSILKKCPEQNPGLKRLFKTDVLILSEIGGRPTGEPEVLNTTSMSAVQAAREPPGVRIAWL
jgi:hypothetical protein